MPERSTLSSRATCTALWWTARKHPGRHWPLCSASVATRCVTAGGLGKRLWDRYASASLRAHPVFFRLTPAAGGRESIPLSRVVETHAHPTQTRKNITKVTTARSTKEALEALEAARARGSPVDLVLKEHEPPASSAARLLRRLAASDEFCLVPVVGALVDGLARRSN